MKTRVSTLCILPSFLTKLKRKRGEMEDRLAPRPEDFTIRIRPGLQESQWDGTVSIDVAWKESNPLNDDDFNQIMHLTQMVCSSVPLMECDDALAKMMADYVETHYVAEE